MDPPGFQNIPENQVGAYLANAGAFKPGITAKEVHDYYNAWSTKYEQDMNEKIYRGPKIAAVLCEILLSDKNSKKILDVASGTGLVGQHLANCGFEFIDGLEPSENMIAVARSKNVYRNFYGEMIEPDKETSIPKDFYDACVTCGSFGEGHIPTKGIYELLRVVRPGGYIIIVMRKEYLDYVKEYTHNLEPFMEKLENEKRWKLVTKFDVENYAYNKDGRIFVFNKTI